MNRRSFVAGLLATSAIVALTPTAALAQSPRWYDPIDYGAWGNGEHNDFHAFQAAIDAAIENVGPDGIVRLRVLPGSYVLGPSWARNGWFVVSEIG